MNLSEKINTYLEHLTNTKLGIADWIVVAIYFVFVILVGVVCKKMNRDKSDYFRGGGQMSWWLSGVTNIMAALSLWSFAAGGLRVYQTGFYMVASYFVGLLFIPLMYYVYAPRFRRMRVVTAIDAVRRRYGRVSEQIWVWSSVPINVFYSGMGLHIMAVFIAAVVGIPVDMTVVIIGVTVVVMSFSGGIWAVSVSNFLQGMVTLVVVLIVCVKVFMLPEVGGISGFVEQLPARMYNFDEWSRPAIYIPLLITMVIGGFFNTVNMSGAGATFLTVKNDSHAKKQVLLSIAGPFLPLLVFLPVMATTWVIPDLGAAVPALERPEEGAYAAIAMKVLPVGMIGLLVSAMFAVQMSSLDAGLNKNAGFMVCNFYQDILRPKASEKELLIAGKVMTLIFGVFIIVIGLVITSLRELDLFQFSLLFATILQTPMVVPMAMGTLIKKTPPWSAWVTLIGGMVVGAVVNLWLMNTQKQIEDWAIWFGLSAPFKELEPWDFRILVGGVAVWVISFAIYFLSMLFWKSTKEEDKKEIESFFNDMATPIIDTEDEEIVIDEGNKKEDISQLQYKIVGGLTAAYGAVIILGIFIPNSLQDRFLFIIAGGIILAVGGVLLYVYKKGKLKNAN